MSVRDEWLLYFCDCKCGEKAGKGVPLPASASPASALELDGDDDGCVSKEQLVNNWGSELSRAPADVRADREVVFAAVERFGGNVLQWASLSLRSDRGFLIACHAASGSTRRDMWEQSPLEHAAPALLADRAFVLELLAVDTDALGFVSAPLLRDKEVVLTAARLGASPLVLGRDDPPNPLLADRDVLRAFCEHSDTAAGDVGATLTLAHADALREDKELLLTAMRRDNNVIQRLAMEFEDEAWLALYEAWLKDPELGCAFALAQEERAEIMGDADSDE